MPSDARGEDAGEDLGEFDFDFPIANARATAGGGTNTELKLGDFRPLSLFAGNRGWRCWT